MDQLKEPIHSSTSSSRSISIGRSTGICDSGSSFAETVTVTVSGCGYDDRETFEVLDVRTARAAMRKLMATGIRLFGRADSAEE